MVSEWIACLDKRPCDRSGEDLDIIYSRLKTIKCFEKFHPLLLQQICYYGYYEDLESGVTLFRQGDLGTNWYTVLSGSLEVQISGSGQLTDAMPLCTLGPGTSFGECILTNRPRHATIITCDSTELIRVEQKDFKVLWEKCDQTVKQIGISDQAQHCVGLDLVPNCLMSHTQGKKGEEDVLLACGVSMVLPSCPSVQLRQVTGVLLHL